MADPQPPVELCFLAIDHWAMCMTKAEWSGWVQAIGSMLAIAAGAAGIAWQVRRQARLAAEAEHRQVRSMTARALADNIETLERAGRRIREFEAWRQATLAGNAPATSVLSDFYDAVFKRTAEQLQAVLQVDYPVVRVKHLCRSIQEMADDAYLLISTAMVFKERGHDWRELLSEATSVDLQKLDAALKELREFAVQPEITLI